MSLLDIHQLTKHYGPIKALDSLDLKIEKGQIFGLLGPNGSGKTTTLGICTGILNPTSGSFQWFDGMYGRDYRRKIGTLLETPNFYTYLSALNNLKIVQQQKKQYNDDLNEILQMVGLYERRKSAYKTYSLGMKQRLAIGAALVGSPEVLILDEPTNGLDPNGIAEIRNIILEIAQMDKTIIMASHILDEVEKVCSHVGILQKGSLIVQGKVSTILGDDNIIEIASSDMVKLKTQLDKYSFVKSIQEKDNYFILNLEENISAEELNKLLIQNGIYVSLLKKINRRLEDEFLSLTKIKAR